MSNPSAEKRPESSTFCARHQCERTVEGDCHVCHGEGVTEDADDIGIETCYNCRGSGTSPWLDCEFCLDEALDEI